MRCWIELDSDALIHNFKIIKQQSSPAEPMLVVKSNAYGHGLQQIYEILKKTDASCLAVNYGYEGIKLREIGFTGRLLVVGPPDPAMIAVYAQHKLEIILGDFEFLTEWQRSKTKPNAHLKIDSGMSRQGFLPDVINKVIERIKKDKNHVVGICSHFANVEDVLEHDYANRQLQAFVGCYERCCSMGLDLDAHIASSASALIMPESRFRFARTGISLYGFWPSSKTRLSFLQKNNDVAPLKPVLTWLTRISSIKIVKAKQYIGYGCSFRAQQDMIVAVLPVGYYEGYPRLAGEKNSYVLIKGQRCSIVGRICMNMMMIDISHIPSCEVGEKVTLIGDYGDETIHAEEVAAWAETIHYEIVTGLNPEIPRFIK